MYGNLNSIESMIAMADVVPFESINTSITLSKDPKWMEEDKVNHPSHYTSHPSGIECIQVTQHYNFCIGNAIKYLWRNGLKTEEGMQEKSKQIEDLKKAIWYINREIENLANNVYE